MPPLIVTTAAIFIAVCITLDVRTRRIPNLVTGSTMVLGTILNTAYSGGSGLAASLLGVFVPMTILLLPFAMGGIGGGDVKMMGALGALVGPRLALWGLVLGMILGGVIMMFHLARRGRLGEKVRATGAMVRAAAATGSVAPLHVTSESPGSVALPYSVPLGLGSLMVLAALRVWR